MFSDLLTSSSGEEVKESGFTEIRLSAYAEEQTADRKKAAKNFRKILDENLQQKHAFKLIHRNLILRSILSKKKIGIVT